MVVLIWPGDLMLRENKLESSYGRWSRISADRLTLIQSLKLSLYVMLQTTKRKKAPPFFFSFLNIFSYMLAQKLELVVTTKRELTRFYVCFCFRKCPFLEKMCVHLSLGTWKNTKDHPK